MVSNVGMSGMNPAMMPRPGSRPDPEEKFQQLDIDGNGTLDSEEMQVMATEISEISGREVTVGDLMDRLDGDGSGTLEIGELPRPAQGDLRGPPPFLDASGNINDTGPMARNFNTTESLLSYLDSNKDDSGSDFGLDLTV